MLRSLVGSEMCIRDRATGKTFIPKMTKSASRNIATQQRLNARKKTIRNVSYGKTVNKSGAVKSRKFKSGGYNNSGKFGKAAGAKTVSYTHLRAHETPEHLVCRLLLEKKKKKTISQILYTLYNNKFSQEYKYEIK
eukprot:TRINITY_DN16020_c0_g1_i2.p1 TRINITY_DN16020_c0_g1~~TRINITY_DN16020_c0_g1_i2.p1  ORF type:complete len:136 (-),score=44.00 TRINITY_DN16020_c0_g1_i2:41-448(-)